MSTTHGQTAPAAGPNTGSRTVPPRQPAPKLDLSKLDPPADLEEVSIEEITIDGICGVY